MKNMFVIIKLLYGSWGKGDREKELSGINNIVEHDICEDRGCKDMY
jgi:hypothetical protein